MSEWKEKVLAYDNSEDVKIIYDEVWSILKKRRAAMERVDLLKIQFQNSDDYKSFKGTNEEDFENLIQKNCGKELIDALKEVMTLHIELSSFIQNYNKEAIGIILDSEGIKLLLDCMKESYVNEKRDFFSVFFERMENMCHYFAENIIGKFVINPEEFKRGGETLH
jgi:hypothetical protein